MSIEVKGLTHIYSEGLPDESLALEDISFRAEDGQLVGLIGHTGSGKSTLVQHLNGLLKPKKGHIIVGDVDITAENVVMRDIRRKIGLVFQYPEYQLFEETVAKDVAFGPSNLGLTAEEVDERVREAIELVGLDYDKVKNLSPFDLSGGQKRRAAIAGVIAMKRCLFSMSRQQVLILKRMLIFCLWWRRSTRVKKTLFFLYRITWTISPGCRIKYLLWITEN